MDMTPTSADWRLALEGARSVGPGGGRLKNKPWVLQHALAAGPRQRTPQPGTETLVIAVLTAVAVILVAAALALRHSERLTRFRLRVKVGRRVEAAVRRTAACMAPQCRPHGVLHIHESNYYLPVPQAEPQLTNAQVNGVRRRHAEAAVAA